MEVTQAGENYENRGLGFGCDCCPQQICPQGECSSPQYKCPNPNCSKCS